MLSTRLMEPKQEPSNILSVAHIHIHKHSKIMELTCMCSALGLNFTFISLQSIILYTYIKMACRFIKHLENGLHNSLHLKLYKIDGNLQKSNHSLELCISLCTAYSVLLWQTDELSWSLCRNKKMLFRLGVDGMLTVEQKGDSWEMQRSDFRLNSEKKQKNKLLLGTKT